MTKSFNDKGQTRWVAVTTLRAFALMMLLLPPVVSAAAPTISEFSRLSRLDPPPGTRLERTSVSDIYAFRFPNNTGKQCAQYLSGDYRFIANQGGKGWRDLKTRSPLSESEAAKIGKQIATAARPLAIPMGPSGKRDGLILISAVDCGYCRGLERQLQHDKIAYRVIPVMLSEENRDLVEAAWSAADQSAAWSSIMSGKADSFPKSAAHGRYPEKALHDMRCMLGGGTPVAIFPDGTMLYGQEIMPHIVQ